MNILNEDDNDADNDDGIRVKVKESRWKVKIVAINESLDLFPHFTLTTESCLTIFLPFLASLLSWKLLDGDDDKLIFTVNRTAFQPLLSIQLYIPLIIIIISLSIDIHLDQYLNSIHQWWAIISWPFFYFLI